MGFVLGVDGGTTKTVALVARTDGTIVGAGRSGCANIYAAGSPEAACAAVAEAVELALATAELTSADLLAGTFSIAGADWQEDVEFLESEMQRRRFGKQISVINDALGALRAGSPDGTGVVVVCGTGTATGARSPDGRVWHSSFWQITEGSRQLGQKTLQAVYSAELGIAPATTLTQRVLSFFGAQQVEDVLHMLTGRVSNRTIEIGKLTPILLEEEERGDPVARQIVCEHGTALGDIALVAARRVGLAGSPFNLVLTGGVLKSPHDRLADALIARVRATLPDAKPMYARYEPAVGAVFFALETLGVPINESLLARLDSTLPPRSLFET